MLKGACLSKHITIADVCNPEIVTSKYSKQFKYDSWNDPQLRKLRVKYGLEKVIRSGKSELDKLQLLNAWAHDSFKKFGQPTLPTHNALEILEEIERGGSFYCAHFAVLLLSAANSLGFVARGLQVKAMPKVTNTEHTICELWSNQYRKWIEMDATHTIYFVTKKAPALPLSVYEIRKELFKNGGKDLIIIAGAGAKKKKYNLKDLPFYHSPYNMTVGFSKVSLAKHANMIFAGSNRWLTDPVDAHPYMLFKGGSIKLNSEKDGSFMPVDKHNNKVKWHKKDAVAGKDIKEAYWTLGEAHIGIVSVEKNLVKVKLTTQTPNFESFLLRIDKGVWRRAKAYFSWKLKPGLNRLTTTVKNKFGVTGPENHISLFYSAPKITKK